MTTLQPDRAFVPTRWRILSDRLLASSEQRQEARQNAVDTYFRHGGRGIVLLSRALADEASARRRRTLRLAIGYMVRAKGAAPA